MEGRFPTWRTLDWEGVKTRAELIAIRVRHFEMRAEDVDEAIARKTRKRQENKDYFDDNHTIRKTEIKVRDLVLRHDVNREVNISSKYKLEYK